MLTCTTSRCYAYVRVSRRNGYTGADCARDIETVPLPADSPTSEACHTANDNGGESNTYRRLLPAAYSDGLQRVSRWTMDML